MPATSDKLELTSTTKTAVVDLLYRLGDDSLIIGHRNSEWTGLGPILEEDIAFSSMAQDKMGHALAFYTLLHQLGEPDPDQIAFGRNANQYRCCSLVALECLEPAGDGSRPASLSNNPVRDTLVRRGDWAKSLVRQFLYSEADSIRIAALTESRYEPLAQLARKLRGEIKYHTLHGRTLLPRLGKATEDSHRRLQTALDGLYPHALGVFEPTPHDAALAEAGICPGEADLCERWQSDVTPLVEQAGLRLPKNAKPVYGGRKGQHSAELAALLNDMQKVYRLDPGAKW